MKTAKEHNQPLKNSFEALKETLEKYHVRSALEIINTIDEKMIEEISFPSWYAEMMRLRAELEAELAKEVIAKRSQRELATFDREGLCVKYNQYVKSHKAQEHLEQLEKNFKNAFDETPDSLQMQGAVAFVQLFLAELGECYPTSVHAQAAFKLSELIEPDDFVETCRNIAAIVTQKI